LSSAGVVNWTLRANNDAASDFTIYQDSTPRLKIDSSGNLGIGTSSPAGRLSVKGSTSDSSANALFVENSVGGAIFRVRNDGDIYMGSGGKAILDSSGNLGLGVTPSAWGSTFRTLQLPGGSSISGTTDPTLQITQNGFYNGTNWIYSTTAPVSNYYQASGQHVWRIAPSGTAGNAISFTQALTLDVNRNLLLNGTTAGASSVGTFTVFNGTAPTGSVTDGVILFAQDISSSSELRVRDEAGNVTTLSPHNFELIPEGPSEEMAWSYYSERDGKRINVDMLKAIRLLEKLSGEQLVYES
jgi:hypothetical protein